MLQRTPETFFFSREATLGRYGLVPLHVSSGGMNTSYFLGENTSRHFGDVELCSWCFSPQVKAHLTQDNKLVTVSKYVTDQLGYYGIVLVHLIPLICNHHSRNWFSKFDI